MPHENRRYEKQTYFFRGDLEAEEFAREFPREKEGLPRVRERFAQDDSFFSDLKERLKDSNVDGTMRRMYSILRGFAHTVSRTLSYL